MRRHKRLMLARLCIRRMISSTTCLVTCWIERRGSTPDCLRAKRECSIRTRSVLWPYRVTSSVTSVEEVDEGVVEEAGDTPLTLAEEGRILEDEVTVEDEEVEAMAEVAGEEEALQHNVVKCSAYIRNLSHFLTYVAISHQF